MLFKLRLFLKNYKNYTWNKIKPGSESVLQKTSRTVLFSSTWSLSSAQFLLKKAYSLAETNKSNSPLFYNKYYNLRLTSWHCSQRGLAQSNQEGRTYRQVRSNTLNHSSTHPKQQPGTQEPFQVKTSLSLVSGQPSMRQNAYTCPRAKPPSDFKVSKVNKWLVNIMLTVLVNINIKTLTSRKVTLLLNSKLISFN